MTTEVIILGPDEGRAYPMGKLAAVFKADGAETGDRYAVSEWWMEPGAQSPGAHSHEANEELFYVIEGTMEILVGKTWHALARGAFIRIPAGIVHDFRNRGDVRAGVLNIFLPGGFEPMMPMIADWFAKNP